MLLLLLVIFQGTRSVFVPNPNAILYERLFGNYRIDFVKTEHTCNRTEWESRAGDVPTVHRQRLAKSNIILMTSQCDSRFTVNVSVMWLIKLLRMYHLFGQLQMLGQ